MFPAVVNFSVKADEPATAGILHGVGGPTASFR
jgi:hypothetical protein